MAEVTQEEPTGLGVAKPIPEDISTSQVWQALVIKIKQPNLFLPVTDIITRPSDDGNGTYREMTLGPNRVAENIYTDESLLEVKFVVTGDDFEHVNIIHTNAVTGERTLEFYKRHSVTGERAHWEVAKKIAEGGIDKVLDLARNL